MPEDASFDGNIERSVLERFLPIFAIGPALWLIGNRCVKARGDPRELRLKVASVSREGFLTVLPGCVESHTRERPVRHGVIVVTS